MMTIILVEAAIFLLALGVLAVAAHQHTTSEKHNNALRNAQVEAIAAAEAIVYEAYCNMNPKS